MSQAYLNRTKNWPKHWKDLKDDERTDIELEEEELPNIRLCAKIKGEFLHFKQNDCNKLAL